MRAFVVGVIKFVAAIAILVGGGVAFTYYKQYPVKAFCSEIPHNSTPDTVLRLAKQKELPVVDVLKTRNVIVLNQDSPFFRFACEVEFKNNKQVVKHVIAAD